MRGNLDQGIGDAWLSLAAELQHRLQEHDPQAKVQATLAPTGLLQLEVRTARHRLESARALARRYEEWAHSICERCGSRVTSARAGTVVSMLCARCSSQN